MIKFLSLSRHDLMVWRFFFARAGGHRRMKPFCHINDVVLSSIPHTIASVFR
ncbi:Uncharacterized protein ChrSV_3738 [Chromobacterium vaccinii]|nr:Uncharacterized protein ChrSW_3738 [Chromobacterium vaccinii]QND91195.1 Uncharacterized protein ChrSV_3738 [Chromobacterium vaccinii]